MSRYEPEAVSIEYRIAIDNIHEGGSPNRFYAQLHADGVHFACNGCGVPATRVFYYDPEPGEGSFLATCDRCVVTEDGWVQAG